MEYYENWQLLAGAVIEKIIYDYNTAGKDSFKKEAMLRWFDTSYAGSLCELVGLDPLFIKESIRRCNSEKTTKKYFRHDYPGIKEVYPEVSEKS